MLPSIYGISLYFTLWIVGAVAAVTVALALAERAGLPRSPSLAALVALAVTIVIGAKLYFLAGYFFFPSIEAVLAREQDLGGMLRKGYRFPGGIVLMIAVMPLVCRAFRLPTLRFADAMIPAVGVAAVFVRIGCFLNGCCYGRGTDGWLGIRFPIGSKAYEEQLLLHEIAWPAEHSLPVHALQLYYAAAGVMLYVLGRYWQANKGYDGEVWARCTAFFFGATFLLEGLRAHVVYINLVVPPVMALGAILFAYRARQRGGVAMRAAA